MSRSILLMNKTHGTFSRAAILIAFSVPHMTPSAASTTIKNPSAIRAALGTTSQKFAWRGVSKIEMGASFRASRLPKVTSSARL